MRRIHGLTLLVLTGAVLLAPPLRAIPLDASSKKGVVVSTSSLASEIGASVLRRGGNAVDAAVATAFALAVVHPEAGNLGGGGFMIIAGTGSDPVAIDYREMAPKKATEDMFVGEDGSIERSRIRRGALAAGVPGTVRGLALAHRLHGTLPWKDLVEPAARLATDGFILTEDLASSLEEALKGALGGFPSSRKAYGKPTGTAWQTGDRIILADLGKSLAAIAKDGPAAFYEGWIADRIVATMEAHGGLIGKDDLRGYEARVREPLRGSYRGHEILSMPPPSSGGVALLEILGLVEPLELRKESPDSPRTLHLLTEAMRVAFVDRARHLGDPDFVDVPVAKLLAAERLRSESAKIPADRARSSASLGRDLLAPPDEGDETTHFSVIDAQGLAVANTYTLEAGWGGSLVVEGAGFLLNNEMGDFNRKPGHTDRKGNIGTTPNVIAPGKRMLSSMTPTIVRKDGKVVLVTGSPGGRTIINTVVRVVLGALEFDLGGRAAVDAPRIHHQWLPDRLQVEEGRFSEATLAALRALGHRVLEKDEQGDAHTIMVDPKSGVATGIADRRRSDDAGVATGE